MLKIGFVFTKKKILKTRVDKMRTGNFNYQPSIVNKQFKKMIIRLRKYYAKVFRVYIV